MCRFSLGIVVLAAVWGGVLGRPAQAENFRVTSAVYLENTKEPASQSVTIFHDRNVYDCLRSPAELVVVDRTSAGTQSANRYVLLNVTNQTRADVTFEQVEAFAKHLRADAVRAPDPLIRFLASPKFEEQYDEAAGELTLRAPLVQYRLTVKPETNAEIVEQYRTFCDQSAQINALLSPGSLPPFGRIEVDAALAKHKAMPSQVTVTYTAGVKNPKQIVRRSTHQVVRPLTAADLERVEKARKSMSTFKVVTFEEYRKRRTP
jgi:hypothetical protein